MDAYKFDLLRKKKDTSMYVLLCDGYTKPRIKKAINDTEIPKESLHVRYHGSPDTVERSDIWLTRHF